MAKVLMSNKGTQPSRGSGKHGSSITSKYRFRPAIERKTSSALCYSFGIAMSGRLFRRNIHTNDASNIAGSQIHKSSLCRMANPRGVKKRVTALVKPQRVSTAGNNRNFLKV